MKNYIDERPLEEIIQSVILDEKHKEFVEEVMDVLTRYNEDYKYSANPYNGDHTVYDTDIAELTSRKKTLEKEKEQLEKMYNASFEKVVALEGHGEEEGLLVEEETKGKQLLRVKPADAAKQKKQEAISAKNFKTTMATTQQEILDLNKELSQISSQLENYLYYQEVSLKSIHTLRRIINHYKIHRDTEFVRKGAYFVKDYSSKLLERYAKAK